MVSIIENWAKIRGYVIGITNVNESMDLIELEVTEISTHENYPNLLGNEPPFNIQVKLKHDTVDELQLDVDCEIEGLVRAAGLNSYFFKGDSIKVL
jgi:hypothetical protein